MNKAIVTFGIGPHEPLLRMSWQMMELYAMRHGYQLMDMHNSSAVAWRPAAWGKLIAIQSAFAMGYDLVLWVDADVLMVNCQEDIANFLPEGKTMAMARQVSYEGDVPDTGVWLLRNCTSVKKLLSRAWTMTQYDHHRWWELAAVLDLMGFDPIAVPVKQVRKTPIYRATQFLPGEWNAHPKNVTDDTRFIHFSAGPIEPRIQGMRTAIEHYALPVDLTE